MSFYFRDSPKLSDRLRGMSDAELLREMKQKFNVDNDTFFEPGRSSRDSFERPFSHFPRGFPFDEADVFEHPRGDGIRAHLDDLATRHPELAEHLRGPPWPFGNSLLRDRRRRRRGSGNNDSEQQGQQHQVDEDARSQASGSSAASGASAVSSHSSGEPDLTSSIPQYGLRNTVDIGQQQRRRDMETSSEKGERGQRSMSAPPENRQQQGQNYQQQQQPQPGQGQRFVSRVDITPQHNQQRSQSPGKPTSNVRHIPIFVEGRDEPVMSKLVSDDAPSSGFPQRPLSPPRHFHRPSHFNEHFSRQQWPPSHFQKTFYEPAGFEQPMRRNQQFQQHQPPQHHQQQPQYHQQYEQPPYHQQQQPQQPQQPPQQPQYHHQQYSQQPPQQQQPPQPQYYQQPSQQQPPQQQQQQQPQQQQQQQQQQEIPKPKPPMPKDPLERVALVQKEVDDLAELVRRYIGGSRQDKEYIYLDEMLTRELLKLDDIETEGRENVRQARKNTIKSIQDTISLLETKAPLSGQQLALLEEEKEKCCEEKNLAKVSESMDVDAKQEKQSGEPIPLPPAPSSPTKTKVESTESTATAAEFANQNIAPAVQRNTELPDMDVEPKIDNCLAKNTEQAVTATSTDKTTKPADEMSKESKPSDNEQRKDGGEATIENKDAPAQQAEEAKKEKIETNGGQRSSTESPRLQKKAKKTSKKEQQPVSEQAIPLPPPPPPPENAK